jgi:hypothetical protein
LTLPETINNPVNVAELTVNKQLGQEGQILSVMLTPKSGIAKEISMIITAPQGGFKANDASAIESFIQRGSNRNVEELAEDLMARAPGTNVEFVTGKRRIDFAGALAIRDYWKARSISSRGSLADLACNQTGLGLVGTISAEKLQVLSRDPRFRDGGYVLMADANRLSVLNRVQSEMDVTEALNQFGYRLTDLLKGSGAIVDRIGDEIKVILPKQFAEDRRKEITQIFRQSLVVVGPEAVAACAMRDALESLEAGFSPGKRNSQEHWVRYAKYLADKVNELESIIGDLPDKKGTKKGQLALLKKVLRGFLAKKDFRPRAMVRVVKIVAEYMVRLRHRIGGSDRRVRAASQPGTFDFASTYLSVADLADPAKVNLAFNACARLVSMRKRGKVGPEQLFVKSASNSSKLERKQSSDRRIQMFNDRVVEYANAQRAMAQLSSNRGALFERLVLAVKMNELLYSHPYISEAFKSRAVNTLTPLQLLGITTDKALSIVKVEVPLKTFNDMGMDLGDKVLRAVVKACLSEFSSEGAHAFIEGGEVSLLFAADKPMVIAPERLEVLKVISERAILEEIKRSFWTEDSEGTRRGNSLFRRWALNSAGRDALLSFLKHEVPHIFSKNPEPRWRHENGDRDAEFVFGVKVSERSERNIDGRILRDILQLK